jgi:hypothetical protein
VVRPRILSTPPIRDTTDNRCEIHVLTSKRDWLNLVWALKSFYLASRRRYSLCIHDDGSLADPELATLEEHFPDARIIRREIADARLAKELRDFPRSLQFRNTNLLAPKIFDFKAFLESDRMGLFDSDLLFFAPPKHYLNLIEDPTFRRNAYNSDVSSAYTVDSRIVSERMHFEILPKINSGFGLVHRDSIQWEWTEEFLSLPNILDGHFWRIEQTLFALCGSRYGAVLLPEEYTLRLEAGIEGRCFRHYIGAIRHLMYGEGIAYLVKNRFLTGDHALKSVAAHKF